VKSAHLKKQGIPTVNTRFQQAAPENGEADLLTTMEAMKPLMEPLGGRQGQVDRRSVGVN
jgi:hypothetical protein